MHFGSMRSLTTPYPPQYHLRIPFCIRTPCKREEANAESLLVPHSVLLLLHSHLQFTTLLLVI